MMPSPSLAVTPVKEPRRALVSACDHVISADTPTSSIAELAALFTIQLVQSTLIITLPVRNHKKRFSTPISRPRAISTQCA
jgi:hypothetical protein